MTALLQKLFERRWAFWTALAVLFFVQAVIRSYSDVNHDAAWYLYVADGLFHGKRMYRDFMEVNPPLAAWQTLAVPYVSSILGVSPVPVFNGLVLVLTAVAIVLASRYLHLASNTSDPLQRWIIVVIAASLLFMPGFNFGEREHILVLLYLPHLLLRACRANGANVHTVEAIAVGIYAALGICLKPQALMAPLAVEAALFMLHHNWRRLFDPENIAASAAALAYVFAVYLFSPEFFTTMLDLAVRAYVPFIGVDAISIMIGGLAPVITLAAAAMLLKIYGTGHRALASASVAATIGFAASYYVQAKGSSYQVLPATVTALLAAASVIVHRRRSTAETGRNPALVLPLVILLVIVNAPRQVYPYLGKPVEDAVARFKPDTRSLFIATTNLSLAFPLVIKNNWTWGSRFPAQWLTPYVSTKWHGGPIPDDGIVRKALDWTVSDLIALHPDVVIVDRSRDQAYVPGGTFDYLAFWAEDPRFADFWAQYRPVGDYVAYGVFVRQ